jgi:predicted transcriptional regulator
VLFPLRIVDAIRDGRVDLAFRRWERARVRPGSRLRTAVGVLEVETVEVVERTSLGDEEARRAGFESTEDLLAMLDERDRGEIHRIELRYAGADPRVELRAKADLSDRELGEIARKLERLDEAGRHGPWTRAVLELIAKKPEVRAEELAAEMGREKLPFKRDVRKLKELGLTISLNPGYRLSPRGKAVLRELRRKKGGPSLPLP